jgi:hypothetical protein
MRGAPVTRLAVWEANYLVDDSRPPLPDDYVAHLDELIVSGRRGEAVEYFMTTAVGIPPEFVAQMRDTPMWKGMEDVAHTLPYDGQVVAGFALPATRLRSVVAPSTASSRTSLRPSSQTSLPTRRGQVGNHRAEPEPVIWLPAGSLRLRVAALRLLDPELDTVEHPL